MFSMTYYEDPGTPALKSVNLSSLNTSRVKDMYGMFSGCELLQAVDLSSFRTARVVDMRNMFFGCSSLKSLDLSTFKTSSVKYLDNMFSGCTGLKKITVSSQWRAVKPGRDMFKDCKRLVGGNGTKYSPKSMGASRAVVDKPGQKGYLALKPAANPMKAKGLMATAKASKLKSKSVTIARSKVIKFKAKPKGKVTYVKVAKGSAKALSIGKNSGAVKVKKGTKKGLYKLRVKVTAAGNWAYASKTQVVTVKVRVR